MYRVFQAFIDGLTSSRDADNLRTVLAEAAAALDLSCFAYLSLPSRKGRFARAHLDISLSVDRSLFAAKV
jgi:hypothetical protein